MTEPTRPGSWALAPWRRSPAHVRAATTAALTTMLAVVLRRPDLLILATPFVVVTTWAWLTRPVGAVEVGARLDSSVVREAEPTTWRLSSTLPPGAEHLVVALGGAAFVEPTPELGVVVGLPRGRDRRVDVAVRLRPTRWGVRPVGWPTVAARSPWGAYAVAATALDRPVVTVLPGPAAFDPSAPTPHPDGVVGPSRSARTGSGTEFDTLRAFRPGDRLRRIHWPSSLRTGELHVASTYHDEDSHIALVVDAFSDLGPREGVDGRPTSLDLTVRAAAAIAEHYLGAGDRVSLRVVGVEAAHRLPVASGRAHQRRVLHTLAGIDPATDRHPDAERLAGGLGAGVLVIVLSPLVEQAVVDLVARLGSRGVSVVVIDTMPDHLWDDPSGTFSALAWRIRRLTRGLQVDALVAAGVPVVPWRGPDSLDQVLRDVSRRARAPRAARR